MTQCLKEETVRKSKIKDFTNIQGKILLSSFLQWTLTEWKASSSIFHWITVRMSWNPWASWNHIISIGEIESTIFTIEIRLNLCIKGELLISLENREQQIN